MQKSQYAAIEKRISGVISRLQEAKLAAHKLASESADPDIDEVELTEAIARSETWLVSLRLEIANAKRQNEMIDSKGTHG